jgi:hypothetical protein
MFTIAKKKTKNKRIKGKLNIYLNNNLYLVKIIVNNVIYNINPVEIQWRQGDNPNKCYYIENNKIIKFIPHATTLDSKLIKFKNNDIVKGIIKDDKFIIC